MTSQSKLNNVCKKRIDLMLRNERLLLIISWNKKTYFGIQKKNVF